LVLICADSLWEKVSSLELGEEARDGDDEN